MAARYINDCHFKLEFEFNFEILNFNCARHFQMIFHFILCTHFDSKIKIKLDQADHQFFIVLPMY